MECPGTMCWLSGEEESKSQREGQEDAGKEKQVDSDGWLALRWLDLVYLHFLIGPSSGSLGC